MFSCLNTVHSVACITTSVEQNTILIFNRPPIKATGGISEFSLLFWFFRHAYLQHLLGRNYVRFWEYKNLSKYNALAFSGQINLKIIAELLKKVPVFLKRLCKPRLLQEQYLPNYVCDTNGVRFSFILKSRLKLWRNFNLLQPLAPDFSWGRIFTVCL